LWINRIVVNKEILGGKPAIAGTRIPVYLILELLGSGLTETEVLNEYPTLKTEDIKASLLYAADHLERNP